MYPNQPNQPPTPPPNGPPLPQSDVYTQPVQPQAPTPAPDGMPSIDYLNQIAPPQKSGIGFSAKQIIMLGGGLLLALIAMAAVMISNSAGPDLTSQSQRLSLRATALENVVKTSQPNIQSRDLSTLNSSLSIQLASAVTSLEKTFTEADIGTGKPRSSIIEEEDKTELLESLEDARLSGIFDRVYTRELTYELEMLLVLLNDIHAASDDESIKTQLEETYQSLSALHKRLVELNSA